MAGRLAPISVLLAVAAAAGCGSGSTTTVTKSVDPIRTPADRHAPIGGGSARCTSAEVAKAAEGAAGRKNPVVISSACSAGWMVIMVGADGPDAPPSTFLFEAEGPFWALVDRSRACLPPSQIPKPLQAAACTDS